MIIGASGAFQIGPGQGKLIHQGPVAAMIACGQFSSQFISLDDQYKNAGEYEASKRWRMVGGQAQGGGGRKLRVSQLAASGMLIGVLLPSIRVGMKLGGAGKKNGLDTLN